MTINYINAGTASATHGSKAITFAGVSASLFSPGDMFIQAGAVGLLDTVNVGAGTAQLVDNWGGATGGAVAYVMLPIPDDVELAVSTRQLMAGLAGALLSIADLTGADEPDNGDILVWDTVSGGYVAATQTQFLLAILTTDTDFLQRVGTDLVRRTPAQVLQSVALAGLTVNDNILQRKAGAAVERTMAQLFADLVAAGNYTGKNVVINGGFVLNQRAYVSAATLASGACGHDRWKGGASGGNYSFTQLNAATQITIAANKSLIQTVTNINVEGGTYTLSWSGTAVARFGKNTATPSGNFAVSPITITGQTAGTVMSVEFTGANAVGGSSIATNTGTLGTVKCETGAVATPYVEDLFPVLLQKCQWYCRILCGNAVTNDLLGAGQALSASTAIITPTFQEMHTAPAITISSYSHFGALIANGSSFNAFTGGSITNITPKSFQFVGTGSSGLVAGNGTIIEGVSTSAKLILDAE